MIMDQLSQILFISNTYSGSVHYKKLADGAEHRNLNETVLIKDLGYQSYKQIILA